MLNTPPRNLKESARAKAPDGPIENHSSSIKTGQSSTEKSITKTSEPVKSTSTTTKYVQVVSGLTSIPATGILGTPITSTESKEASPGTGARVAGRRRKIARAIRLVWDSLESHLDAAAGAELLKECCNEMVGKPPFHRKCVKEYGEVIQTLTELL